MFKLIAISVIKTYRKLMLFWRATPLPLANSQCRFYPSCSEYAEMAIESKGVLRGSAKTFYRVLRCHPLSRGGVDMP